MILTWERKDKVDMGISVVLLAYKEEENLRILLPQIHQYMKEIGEKYEILVIDSEKPLDGTAKVCAENNALYFPQEEPHYGGAFRTGIKYARYDKLQTLDADGSHKPCTLPEIYRRFMEGNDIVIGSRYVKGGTTHDARSSVIMSHLLNTVMRICIGVKTRDISTAFRLYDTELLKRITLNGENYDVLQEVILKMKIEKKRQGRGTLLIGEVPIEFEKRMFGESKRNLVKFIFSYARTLCKLLKLRITNR